MARGGRAGRGGMQTFPDSAVARMKGKAERAAASGHLVRERATARVPDTPPTPCQRGTEGSSRRQVDSGPVATTTQQSVQVGRETKGAVLHGRPGTVAGLANQSGSRRPYCPGRATLLGRTLLGAPGSTLGRATQSGSRRAGRAGRPGPGWPGRGATQAGWPHTDAGHIRTLSSYHFIVSTLYGFAPWRAEQ